jgi:hypothetical protein
VDGFFLADFITFLLFGGGGGVFLLPFFKACRRCSVLVAVTAMPSMLPAVAVNERKQNKTKQNKAKELFRTEETKSI